MIEIRDIAEPLHTADVGLEGHYNAGIDALVDAVESQGYVLVKKEEL